VPRQGSEDKDYELLTQAVYQTILKQQGYENITVQHDVDLTGRTGATHQIDVYWHFRQAGVGHKVLVECKNYSRKISLGKIRDFKSVMDEVGPCQGIMVTKTGYQSGVKKYARHHGIGLKLLSPADPATSAAGIQFVFHMHLRTLSMKHKIQILPIWSKPDEAQLKRLKALQEAADFSVSDVKDLILFDRGGNPRTGHFADWLQRNLTITGRDIGGPYIERISLVDHYFPVNLGKANQELVPLDGIDVTFWIAGADETIAFHAHQVVEAILRDEFSGEVEHIHRRSA
jgi:Restriction endonuclease